MRFPLSTAPSERSGSSRACSSTLLLAGSGPGATEEATICRSGSGSCGDSLGLLRKQPSDALRVSTPRTLSTDVPANVRGSGVTARLPVLTSGFGEEATISEPGTCDPAALTAEGRSSPPPSDALGVAMRPPVRTSGLGEEATISEPGMCAPGVLVTLAAPVPGALASSGVSP